jgi:hypothetical protein
MDNDFGPDTLAVRAGIRAQPVQRARRGAVPHLELRLRQCRPGGGPLLGRGGRLRLWPLLQPDRQHAAGAPGGARRRRGLHRHGLGMAAILSTVMATHEGGRAHRHLPGHFRRHPAAVRRHPVEVRHRDHLRRFDRSSAFRARSPRDQAGLHRDAVEPAHRGVRHRRAGRRSPMPAARCWRWTTASARRRCSARSISAPIWSIHSATKYLDGQGRVLGGAVVGSKALTEEVFKFLRTAGPSCRPSTPGSS